MKRFSAEGILFLITLIWGATFVIIKSALQDISPMLFISFRSLSAYFISLNKISFNSEAKQLIKMEYF
jgi:drug/metabolite transporter (DMT)-like permease